MKKILIIFTILFIASCFIWFYVFHKPKPDYKKTTVDYTTTAKQLYDDYTSGCGNKYTGKVISISGIADNIEDYDSVITVIFVFNEGSIFSGKDD